MLPGYAEHPSSSQPPHSQITWRLACFVFVGARCGDREPSHSPGAKDLGLSIPHNFWRVSRSSTIEGPSASVYANNPKN